MLSLWKTSGSPQGWETVSTLLGALGRDDSGPRLAHIRPAHNGQRRQGQWQRRETNCCHRSLLTKAVLYLLHHCLQLRGHHPDLINESVHWEGAKHTCPLHIQKDTCVRLPKRPTHTKDPPLLLHPWKQTRKAAFWYSTKRGGCGREENTHSLDLLT